MVLALVDDLMFRSKIKSAATQLGVSIAFVGSRDAALSTMRLNAPALVILDLNNPRTDPLGTVTAMKHDNALAPIYVVGFVSHVDVNTVNEARAAGVDEILARSAFTTRLPDLLAGR
ncbi:MAG TPA: response regulator [Vicinamibacterales bacterium]|nr:response regulator [Vicinamibacterales bacterium]